MHEVMQNAKYTKTLIQLLFIFQVKEIASIERNRMLHSALEKRQTGFNCLGTRKAKVENLKERFVPHLVFLQGDRT
jgi:hypothetical protein